jgi:imidazolonepropionase
LNLENEVKQLTVLKELNESLACPMSIIPTFMGAHAVPKEYSHNEYVDVLTEQMLPQIACLGLAEYCDVFCEKDVFTVEDCRRILLKARECGLKLKLHADEIESCGGAELAAELGAVSAEHLIQASDDGIRAMVDAGVMAVLLPATSFYLDKPYAQARAMLDRGMAVAVASDFNPGSSPCLNLQFAMTLACLKYRLTPAECLTAVTLNAAAAIGRAESIGTLEAGKLADIVIWDAPDLDFLFYRHGNNQADVVIKSGKL